MRYRRVHRKGSSTHCDADDGNDEQRLPPEGPRQAKGNSDVGDRPKANEQYAAGPGQRRLTRRNRRSLSSAQHEPLAPRKCKLSEAQRHDEKEGTLRRYNEERLRLQITNRPFRPSCAGSAGGAYRWRGDMFAAKERLVRGEVVSGGLGR